MKAFIGVLAVLLLVFGASVIYFRGDFNVDKKLTIENGQLTKGKAETQKTGAVAGQSTPVVTPKFSSLEVLQSEIPALKVSESRTLTAVAKDETGALVSVEANWRLSNPNLGTLSTVIGTETKFTARKIGKVKVLVSYKEWKTEKEFEVLSGTVAGVTTSVVSTAPTTTASTTSTGNVGVGSTLPPVAPFEIKLYDPTGSRFNIGESRSFTAQVQYTDNSVKTPDLDWLISPSDLGSLDRSKGASVSFKALKSGSGTIKATLGNLSSSLYLQVN